MERIALNLAEGDSVDGLERLNGDAGLCEVVRRAECAGMPQRQRGEMEGRFRGGRERTVPSPPTMRRFVGGGARHPSPK